MRYPLALLTLPALLAVPVEASSDGIPRGLVRNEGGAFPGYTLIAPMRSKTVFLIDMEGNVVHRWDTGYAPGSEYLLENGNLLRCSKEPNAARFRSGGQGGRIQEIAWDGTVVWDYRFANDDYLQHHDIAVTPDGTVLMIAWEYKSRYDAFQAGRIPTTLGKEGFWPDFVVEVEPARPDGGEVIWEWHVWDHLVQDVDPEKANSGKVEEHPELVDINGDIDRPELSDEQVEQLKTLGYVNTTANRGELRADWLHTNAIHYNAERDQILLCVPHMNEVWIIDHSTTTDEAAGHSGGNGGRGGDLLYRWGHPKVYRAGTAQDQRLFYQHDAQWVLKPLPGAGNLLVFNNGGGRPDGNYSSVVELALPLEPDGTYRREAGKPFGPLGPVWEYVAPDKSAFFSGFISGAQRLPNGNTLICEGAAGRAFEVTTGGEIVWEYVNELGLVNQALDGQPAPQHALFRATRIPLDHPGLQGKELRPLAAGGGASR
ncbi:MAG: aryl-sulfate sulfotransferase [Planctomycetota bacterium]